MEFIADLHIHSHFSRATSPLLTPEILDFYGGIKGIRVIGTGDITHPGWTKELKEKLVSDGTGLFKLKPEYKIHELNGLPARNSEVRFMLTGEISSIYKKGGRVRKVHNVIFAPDFETIVRIQNKITRLGGNITSDGRPILGLDSRDLLELALDASPDIFFVPAHIWTPWFSVLGSKSGFDSISECFGDLSDHISAVETGLSTDPPMHWMCTFLDKFTLISNSDAHSPEKLGRNANSFNCNVTYMDMIEALRKGDNRTFHGTIDLYPQEGKYHFDGHRKCGIRWDPVQTLEHNGICPVCGKKVTVGVLHRVMQLADRTNIYDRSSRLPYQHIIPLKELLSEISGVGEQSKHVAHLYHRIIRQAGDEFQILREIPLERIQQLTGNETLVEALRRMRSERVYVHEGFDGEYGKIYVFSENELHAAIPQMYMFDSPACRQPAPVREALNVDIRRFHEISRDMAKEKNRDTPEVETHDAASDRKSRTPELNSEQLQAVRSPGGPMRIIAGPGTGKTHVLTQRIAYLINHHSVKPKNILAVTFTNKAAKEMRDRLSRVLKRAAAYITISTFHALGYAMLSESATGKAPFSIISSDDRTRILMRLKNLSLKAAETLGEAIATAKMQLLQPSRITDYTLAAAFEEYESFLHKNNLYDLNDLIYYTVLMLRADKGLRKSYQKKFKWIFVDEFQDINYAQYEFLRILMPNPESNLCVIGDPDQAIYGFRGADSTYIAAFLEDYPNAETVYLQQSYRCAQTILTAAAQVIGSDASQKLRGRNEIEPIRIIPVTTERSEAESIARIIEEMIGGTTFFSMDSRMSDGNADGTISSLSDFAVLYRLNRQSAALEKAMKDHGIAFQTIGEKPFTTREPARTILNILNLCLNPGNKYLSDLLKNQRIVSSRDALSRFARRIKTLHVREIVDLIASAVAVPETEKSTEILRQLLDFAVDYGKDVSAFLRDAALNTSVDMFRRQEAVSLMTIHAAKGLEFPCVFIAGCEDGLIPYTLFQRETTDTDSERRLFYVGMTRAKTSLLLTHARRRRLFGRTHLLEPSPYIRLISDDLTDVMPPPAPKPVTRDAGTQLNLF